MGRGNTGGLGRSGEEDLEYGCGVVGIFIEYGEVDYIW